MHPGDVHAEMKIAVDKVMEIHVPCCPEAKEDCVCDACGTPWPCETAQILQPIV